MPANTSPIFPLVPKVAWNTGALTAANTAKDGTGAVVDIMPVVGVNGARIDQILIRPLGTNVATVLRLFVNNGGANTTATNNALIHEITMPATTVSETASIAGIDVAIAKDEGKFAVVIPYLPAGYKIFATIGTAVAAGFKITTHYGEY